MTALVVLAGIVAVLCVLALLLPRRARRRKGEPFDWSHRRPWWKPRWAFPDDR